MQALLSSTTDESGGRLHQATHARLCDRQRAESITAVALRSSRGESQSTPSAETFLSQLSGDERWTCGACTLENSGGTQLCDACGGARPWRCRTCTCENEARARACDACGRLRHEPEWRCACTLFNAASEVACAACGTARDAEVSFAPLPTRLQSSAEESRWPSPPRASCWTLLRGNCLACTPRRACHRCVERRRDATATHHARAREQRECERTSAHIGWEAGGMHALYDDPDIEQAALSEVPSELRSAVALFASTGDAGGRDAASMRRMMEAVSAAARRSGDLAPAECDATPAATQDGVRLVLDTDWGLAGRNPHRRVEALRRAGWWMAAGGRGTHPKWRREGMRLPCGCHLPSQILTFSSTPSDCRSWDNDAAKLQREDAQVMSALALCASDLRPAALHQH